MIHYFRKKINSHISRLYLQGKKDCCFADAKQQSFTWILLDFSLANVSVVAIVGTSCAGHYDLLNLEFNYVDHSLCIFQSVHLLIRYLILIIHIFANMSSVQQILISKYCLSCLVVPIK